MTKAKTKVKTRQKAEAVEPQRVKGYVLWIRRHGYDSVEVGDAIPGIDDAIVLFRDIRGAAQAAREQRERNHLDDTVIIEVMIDPRNRLPDGPLYVERRNSTSRSRAKAAK